MVRSIVMLCSRHHRFKFYYNTLVCADTTPVNSTTIGPLSSLAAPTFVTTPLAMSDPTCTQLMSAANISHVKYTDLTYVPPTVASH